MILLDSQPLFPSFLPSSKKTGTWIRFFPYNIMFISGDKQRLKVNTCMFASHTLYKKKIHYKQEVRIYQLQ
ncbi:hypothetical protein AX774_g4906 [Zancudomyces culisetae]|uniref:Uncharacterized protein n=1 Tax=Zancudomyces culisetae TaxID=1213189 RepID=A0A1R1PKZ4_ZANCU|nr:hypothetical protein AX774_g4906 [Zancudomyces culisetae]|eukprot:OMH81634.1 hypothetical protein AX774_g4906 [Zancudomyces culisetae]